MKKIRASYSFLNLWSQGKIQEALLSYFYVPHPTPPQFVNGRIWDEYCQDYIKREAKLPPEWGGDTLKQPIVQMKTRVAYNAISTLTGVYDIYDKECIYELKSGHSNNARGYAGTMQIPLYLLIADLAEIPVQNALVIRYNPKTNSQDRALVYPSARIKDKARNFLESIVPEIYEYFEKNDLFNKTTEDMRRLLLK